MPIRPLRQKAKIKTFMVRARLGHQWQVDEDGVSHPGPKVVDLERFNQGAKTGKRAYIGYVFDKNLAEPGVSEGGWRPTVEPQEISQCAEYIQAIVHGDLWPADHATAKAVESYAIGQGVQPPRFDASYGGELKELTDWLQECEDARLDAIGNVKPVVAPVAVTPPKTVASLPVIPVVTPKPEVKKEQ